MDHEIAAEQAYLDALHARVDVLRGEAVARLAAGSDTAGVWRAELARLESVADGLCFGRLDMRDGGRVYVGRLGLFRDEDDEPLLVDWRAPAARPFYTATMAAPEGVRLRRRITTRGRVVVGLEDEPLDQDTFVGQGALMAALAADRTGRMGEIVTTLQAEQDRIVRDDHPGVLVVQGGPGTGKTAVALHRLAYLLYTRPHLRTRGVLVIGPSRIFLDYIGQVLPGLGEHAAVTATLADLVADLGPSETASAEGGADVADRIVAAVRARVRVPDWPVEVEFEQQVLRLEPRDCRRAVEAAAATGLPHNQARLVFQDRIVDFLTGCLVEHMENVVFTETGEAIDGGSSDGRLSAADLRALAAAGVVVDDDDDHPRSLLDETDRAHLRDALLADADVRDVLDELWPALTPREVVTDLFGTADAPLLDEAAVVIGTSSVTTYGHVVVDEAQELSPMAWRMVMRRCPTRSMTIVGDLAQTGTPAGASSWDQVLRPHVGDHWRLAELTVNYRTPAEIMAATADLRPDLTPPRSIRTSGEPPWRCRTTSADLADVVAGIVTRHPQGQLAIIAPASYVDRLAPALVLTPRQAKGLEFDSVIVVDPAAILAAPLGHNDLYVAMTRATRRLVIVHLGPPPAELSRIDERAVRA